MPQNHFLFYAGQIILDLLRQLLFFPVWWYGRGSGELLKKCRGFLADSLKALNLTVWLKNLFVPMYGQRDFAGALISFFMRIFQIILRGIGFLFLLIFSVAALVLWWLLPALVFYQIIYQLV